jgi:hypothetical protein
MFGLGIKNIWKISILMGALFVFRTTSFGQTNKQSIKNSSDTVIMAGSEPNSSNSQSDSLPLKVYTVHHTKVATIASALIPGLGQAYNRKFWKIPLIYGGGTILYYLYDKNNYQYQRFKSVFNSKNKILDPDMQNADIFLNMENFRRNRDRAVIGMGLLYVANVVDAMVDSYMTEYDISKDLSMKISPVILQPSPALCSALPGIKMSLRF